MVDLSVNIHQLELSNPVMTRRQGHHTGVARGQRLSANGRDGQWYAQLRGIAKQGCGLFL